MAAEQAEKIIMGVDPGTNIMGYGFLRIKGRKTEMLSMGVIDMRRIEGPYTKLAHIYERITGLIESFLPDEMAIEAPFVDKNIQSTLKLGRAQGVAIAAAVARQVPVTEYAPMKIKMAITGNGSAGKDQVAFMLKKLMNIPADLHPKFMDSTDALGAAYCHYLQQMGHHDTGAKSYKGWKDFITKNSDRVSKNTIKK